MNNVKATYLWKVELHTDAVFENRVESPPRYCCSGDCRCKFIGADLVGGGWVQYCADSVRRWECVPE